MKNIFFIVLIILGNMLSACVSTKNACDGSKTATVISGVDGCGWLLQLENGEVLNPTNLEDMKIELNKGNTVEINYEKVEEMNICMMGTTVKLSCIVISK
ncbi:hypothetical protein [Lishizhenia sp.]|uniref:hypothetical protein n=1 Tax=Lishizhenia sp. TaxID=2497594 RepID=UPI00299E942A|nr:hypothetical protein [Lishizhenia sp.]MDX1446775.1 hypothetical protein [Lishizhenia sp.]